MRAFAFVVTALLASQAQAFTGWNSGGAGEVCSASAQAACTVKRDTNFPQFSSANGWSIEAVVDGAGTGATCFANKEVYHNEFAAVTKTCDVVQENPCTAGSNPSGGHPVGSHRTNVDPTETRCDGTCTIEMIPDENPDVQWHTGGAYGATRAMSYSGAYRTTGTACTVGSGGLTDQTVDTESCGEGTAYLLVGGTTPGCLPKINITGMGDGNSGLSGPAGSEGILDNKPADKYDPSLCGTESVAMRDPIGGGTLCVEMAGWGDVQDPVRTSGTINGEGPGKGLERDFESGDLGGGTGGGTGGGGPGTPGCGLPDTAPCKIDETGTPTAGEVSLGLDAVKQGIASAGQGHVDKIAGMSGGGGGQVTNLGLTWSPTIPVGTCTELSFTIRGQTYTSEWCPLLGQARTFFAWAVMFMAALYVWRRATGTVARGNDSA